SVSEATIEPFVACIGKRDAPGKSGFPAARTPGTSTGIACSRSWNDFRFRRRAYAPVRHVAKPCPEEPDAGILHVRICGGPGSWAALPLVDSCVPAMPLLRARLSVRDRQRQIRLRVCARATGEAFPALRRGPGGWTMRR